MKWWEECIWEIHSLQECLSRWGSPLSSWVLGFHCRSSHQTLWTKLRNRWKSEPPAVSWSMGPCGEGPGHGFPHMYSERERWICTRLKRAVFCIFFQEHKETEILSLFYSKCHLSLKIVKSVGLSVGTVYYSRCAAVCFHCTAKACLCLWADSWRLFSFSCGCWWKMVRGQLTCWEEGQK